YDDAAPRRATPSLHDALPILPSACSGSSARPRSASNCRQRVERPRPWRKWARMKSRAGRLSLKLGRNVYQKTDSGGRSATAAARSEEHTSELQSRENIVCRLL